MSHPSPHFWVFETMKELCVGHWKTLNAFNMEYLRPVRLEIF